MKRLTFRNMRAGRSSFASNMSRTPKSITRDFLLDDVSITGDPTIRPIFETDDGRMAAEGFLHASGMNCRKRSVWPLILKGDQTTVQNITLTSDKLRISAFVAARPKRQCWWLTGTQGFTRLLTGFYN